MIDRLAYLCCLSLGLAACRVISTDAVQTDPGIANFTGSWVFSQGIEFGSVTSFAIHLPQTPDCDLLPDDVTASLDSVPARIFVGDNRDGVCQPPVLLWPRFITLGLSTVLVGDNSMTWLFTIDNPFVARTLVEVAPDPGTPVHGGEIVQVAVTPPSIDLSSLQVSLVTDTGSQLLTTEEDGGDTYLVMPQAAAQSKGRIVGTALGTMTVTHCDAPGGCASGVQVTADFAIDLEP